ncbi:MAG TPA: hypothetical protein VFU59_07335 [Candidatus Eisenbacteria bacterium]|nr:hypothetical protein [Candidatus Eisenbacteria bacterium]
MTPSAPDRKYVDHPAPSVIFVAILLIMLGVLISIIPGVSRPSTEPTPLLEWILLGSVMAITAFYFWPIYTTYYTVSAAGLDVRYGPWSRHYPWSDFAAAYWQRGMFATRIGWPTVTPCVRFTNAVLLKRNARGFGLYLTPNDPKAFLRTIGEFAPALTAEAIL